jgi:drug/metabolite transporter (DMT)-like permease
MVAVLQSGLPVSGSNRFEPASEDARFYIVAPKFTVLAQLQLAPVTLSLAATLAWGMSDFVGGYASRRANAILLTTITHVSGTSLMLALALLLHSPFPEQRSVRWAVAAGLLGGTALAVFYRALSAGNMGLTAPVGAVLGAAIPTIVDAFVEGIPGPVRLAGFALAGLGIWLISRSEGTTDRAEGIGLAALAGLGFAGYFLCIKQAGDGSPLWIAVVSRSASLLATGLIVILTRQFRPMDSIGIRWGILAGVLDVSGSAFFIQASQSGRLDTAVMVSSLYPAFTVLLARIVLKEHFTHWKVAGLVAALLAVPMIAT